MKRRNSIIVLLAGLGLLAAGATGQDKDREKREAQLRVVRGAVVDKEENPVAGAVVYLKNLKTQMVKTHIAAEDGKYRFSGLDPNLDYEIHSELAGLSSNRRTISSFDTRKEIVIHLKLDKKKAEK